MIFLKSVKKLLKFTMKAGLSIPKDAFYLTVRRDFMAKKATVKKRAAAAKKPAARKTKKVEVVDEAPVVEEISQGRLNQRTIGGGRRLGGKLV